MLIYLSDVEEGGETVFPLEGTSGLDRLSNIDYRKCNQGLQVGTSHALTLPRPDVALDCPSGGNTQLWLLAHEQTVRDDNAR